jgi:hypothetical protein
VLPDEKRHQFIFARAARRVRGRDAAGLKKQRDRDNCECSCCPILPHGSPVGLWLYPSAWFAVERDKFAKIGPVVFIDSIAKAVVGGPRHQRRLPDARGRGLHDGRAVEPRGRGAAGESEDTEFGAAKVRGCRYPAREIGIQLGRSGGVESGEYYLCTVHLRSLCSLPFFQPLAEYVLSV